jgi:Two component regulator propeller
MVLFSWCVKKKADSDKLEVADFGFVAWGLLLFLCLQTTYTVAQENIPLGTWRTHLSFNSVSHVVGGNSKIYTASENGILQYDINEQSSKIYSTLNALSSAGISTLAYDSSNQQLIVGYVNGNIDFIKQTSVLNSSALVNPPDISVAPVVNSIRVYNTQTYFCTNYGIAVYDLARNEIRETWRNLNSTGQLLAINEVVVKADSIYAATAKGVIVGKLTDNLLDFNQWNRYESGDLNANIESITLFDNKIFCAISGKGIYRFTGTNWQKELVLPVCTAYRFIKTGTNELLIAGDERLWRFDATANVIELVDLLIEDVADVQAVGNKYWVADGVSGLLSDMNGNWMQFLANGPVASKNFRSVYENDKMYAVHGGFSSTFIASNPLQALSIFNKGIWTSTPTQVRYVSDVAQFEPQSLYVASFGDGVQKINSDGSTVLFNTINSSLQLVTALAKAKNGIWISNYNSAEPLQFLKADNTLQAFTLPTIARVPFDIAVDFSGNVWMLLAKSSGGVYVVDASGEVLAYINDQPGSGLLPDKEVLSVAVDKDGFVWIGTAKGVAYYTFVGDDGIRPIVGGRFLLSDERVTALAIDGGNRKWMGTENGVWLFDDIGENVIYNFTTENSPLPSNAIQHIEVDSNTGEVFFSTDKGLISFRADATEAENIFGSVKIFPNPVTKAFSGLVGITNLYNDAIVKITDVSGKLVKQLQANGGTASWNVTDDTGKRVGTGVYLVLASSQDGIESIAGKIVVID